MSEIRMHLTSYDGITVDEAFGLDNDIKSADEYMKSEYGCIPREGRYWVVTDPLKFTVFQLKYSSFIKRIEII